MKNLINLIKKYREEHHMTLREFGELLGVSHATVDNIEKGTSEPSISIIKKIATTLNITVIINPNDELKIFNAFSESDVIRQLENSKLDPALINFIKDSRNEIWLRVAKIMSEAKDGPDDFAVRTIWNAIKKG